MAPRVSPPSLCTAARVPHWMVIVFQLRSRGARGLFPGGDPPARGPSPTGDPAGDSLLRAPPEDGDPLRWGGSSGPPVWTGPGDADSWDNAPILRTCSSLTSEPGDAGGGVFPGGGPSGRLDDTSPLAGVPFWGCVTPETPGESPLGKRELMSQCAWTYCSSIGLARPFSKRSPKPATFTRWTYSFTCRWRMASRVL